MKNLIYYVLIVLIWGSSWIGIKMQLGVVEPVVSVAYRFSLAAVILLIWCLIRRLNMRFSLQDHFFIFLQGFCLFGVNYLLFYIAELYIASGLAAVIFSTIVLMNIVNGTIFLKSPVDRPVVVGGLLGLIGIGLVFKSEISSVSADSGSFAGIILSIIAIIFSSFGNIISARNQRNSLPIIQTNAYGMAYGAGVMVLAGLVTGRTFGFEFSGQYIGSLLFLGLFASVIAFGCYLALIGNIGADRAAYATLLFPIVSLAISTVWENYQWTVSAAAEVLLILFGNLWIIRRKTGRK